MGKWISFFDDDCCSGRVIQVIVNGNSFSVDFDVNGIVCTLNIVKSGNTYSGSYDGGSVDWVKVYYSQIDGWLVRCQYIEDGEGGVWELFIDGGVNLP